MAFPTGVWNTSTLTATYKEVYADDMENLVKGKNRYLAYNRISYDTTHKPGLYYHKPVVLTFDGFFEYRPADAVAFTFNDPYPAKILDAKLLPSNIYGRSRITTETAARGSTSRYAFQSSIGVVAESLFESTVDRLESDLWNGGLDIGVVSALANTAAVAPGPLAAASGNVPAFSFQISYDSWSLASLAGHEGSLLVAYDGGSTWIDPVSTVRAQAGGAGAVGKITKVDIPNRIITMDELPTSLDVGDRITFSSQWSSAGVLQTMYGIHFLTGSTSGSPLNISTDYSKWVASQVAVGGHISLNAIASGMAEVFGKGLSEDADAVFAPLSWVHLATDWSALKRGDLKNTHGFLMGTNDLEITLLGIKTKIECSPYCRHGMGVLIPFSIAKRIGASDVTDKVPGMGGDYFMLVPGTNTYEFQTYSNQAVFLIPGKTVCFTGITG